MRTALVLLLLLALAAIPGSVVPQEGVDSLATTQWREEHPTLTPVYERLGLFSVFDSPWFSAIYLLLMVSLVGCILPRTRVYWRALRAAPPVAPRNLARLPAHTAYTTEEDAAAVLDRARRVLKRRRYRLAVTPPDGDAVAAERGYLREAGNLLFHVAVLVVLVGFAVGSLFGYKGGVIVLVGNGFANGLTQYDDFDPGSLFDPDRMEPFFINVDDFEVEWITEGRAKGMARKFVSALTWKDSPSGESHHYDLRVNHPLTIGGTEVFLIGHGYAPVITVRDGNGDVTTSGPTIFLPQDQSFLSFGVVKAPDAEPTPIGLEGLFYPTYLSVNGDPVNVMGDLRNPTLSLEAYTGDLGLDDGTPQSVYVLDKSNATKIVKPDGSMFRVDLQPGQTVELPDGAGSVTFEGVQRWNRIQISRTPGKLVALTGVVLALLGMLLSLFVRPRRVWVRVRPGESGTQVEVAGLERTDGGDISGAVADIVAALRPASGRDEDEQT
jgi:cytochrome c biogenesis protein